MRDGVARAPIGAGGWRGSTTRLAPLCAMVVAVGVGLAPRLLVGAPPPPPTVATVAATVGAPRPVPLAVPQRRASARPRRPSRAPAPPPLRYRTPHGVEALAADLTRFLGGHTRRGSWGALVVSLSRGDTLFAHGADDAMVPASTMKLFTAALALDALGPAHSLRTEVLRDGPLDPQGVVRGNLILRGEGDPSLSPRFVRGGADAPMALLAELTAGAGVKRVAGDLIADASAFEARGIPEGWLSRYAGASYAAPFSALSLNENVVVVRVTPGAPGAPPTVAFEPATDGLTVVNSATTAGGGAGA